LALIRVLPLHFDQSSAWKASVLPNKRQAYPYRFHLTHRPAASVTLSNTLCI
jgi:hypothetical protein